MAQITFSESKALIAGIRSYLAIFNGVFFHCYNGIIWVYPQFFGKKLHGTC
jgi:hypothetical protein